MKTVQGFIYFIQMGEDGPVKIGYSTTVENLRHRLDFMQVGNPAPLLLRGVIRGSQRDEQALHRAVWQHRLRGEWFTLSEQIGELLDKCESVADLPVVHRRQSAVRMEPDKALAIWNDATLTEVEALHLMTGWSQHYARRLLGDRLGRPSRNSFDSKTGKAAARKSWKKRAREKMPAKEALVMWRDIAKHPNTQELVAKMAKHGWTSRMLYKAFGPRFPELRMGRPRKPEKS